MPERCRVNLCTREPGAGTWLRVRLEDGIAGEETVVKVCEEHWAAIASVSYPD